MSGGASSNWRMSTRFSRAQNQAVIVQMPQVLSARLPCKGTVRTLRHDSTNLIFERILSEFAANKKPRAKAQGCDVSWQRHSQLQPAGDSDNRRWRVEANSM